MIIYRGSGSAGPLLFWGKIIMAVSFELIPSRGLVYVRYSDLAGIDETIEAAQSCMQHPDFKPGLRHLFDVSRVTEVDQDFAKFFGLQARLVEFYEQAEGDQLIAFYAPNPAGQVMARMAQKTWEPMPEMVIKTFVAEADALAFLGQPERSVKELFQAAG